jgi:hypothetical protein
MPRFLSLIIMAFAIVQSLAFAPISTSNSIQSTHFKSLSPTTTSSLNMDVNMLAEPTILSNSNAIAAATVDPTTALSQVLGGLLGSYAILFVPILAAVSVASVIAWFIVSYANPADPDDD